MHFVRLLPRSTQRSDREPSRIPVKQLGRASEKNRLIRRLVRNNLKKNVPKSSRIPEFTNKSAFHGLGMYCSGKARKKRRKSHEAKSSRIREFANELAFYRSGIYCSCKPRRRKIKSCVALYKRSKKTKKKKEFD